MQIETIRTGYTLVSSAVPARRTHRWGLAYTRLFQSKSSRIKLPVKCFYVCAASHHILIDAGWSREVAIDSRKHLGSLLNFASEAVMRPDEAAVEQLRGKPIDAVYMTHLDCDHISGLHDFKDIPVYASREEIEICKKSRMRYGTLVKGLDIQPIAFDKDDEAPFGRSTDIFGDGSIIAYLTPTHSAGSVLYKVTEGEKYALIVGDNAYNEDSWKKGWLPGPLYNAENMKKILAWIKERSEDSACTGIYCAHDPVDR